MKMSGIAQKPQRVKPQSKIVAKKKGDVLFSTVALIGPDGAGKTTVAKAILETCPLQIKYLYMGVSIESSNVALPTSRLLHKWRVYKHRKSLERSGKEIPERITLHGLEHRLVRVERGALGSFARLLNRISELSYRQLVSWFYQLRGNIVLYDRHFLFDLTTVPTDTDKYRITDRVHCWFLQKLYPRPGLVIFLDAPADVMYARKQEVPIDYLQKEQKKLAQKNCYAQKKMSVDATKPLEEVVEIVNEIILCHCKK